MSNFNDVKIFMETYGQEVKDKSEFPNEKIVKLRIDLIKEELDELSEAINKKDIVQKWQMHLQIFYMLLMELVMLLELI